MDLTTGRRIEEGAVDLRPPQSTVSALSKVEEAAQTEIVSY